jgi:hypothetical protein
MPRVDAPPFVALAAAAITILGGTISTYSYDRRSPLPWRVAMGACTGLTAFGLIGFLLAMRFGLTSWVVIAAATATACPIAFLASSPLRLALADDLKATAGDIRSLLASLPKLLRVMLPAIGIAVLWQVSSRAMFVRADGIFTGISHNIGDLPFHLAVTNRFVHGANFPPEHPSFAGVGFTYPFLTDFIGAMFVRTGAPVRQVIVWSTFLFCLAVAALLYRWTLELTGSRSAAFLAPPLALWNGGFGWWRLVGESWNHPAPWAFLARLPHDYTITSDTQFRWGNMVTTLLVTQRGLLVGLPLALIVFRLWWSTDAATNENPRELRARMIAAGVITGMLPLVHAHTFAVVVGVAVCLALLASQRWVWLPFFMWSLALGLPQVWWLAQAGGGVSGGTFVDWSIGWDHGNQHVVLFWLKNTGLFVPLLLAAILWRGENPLLERRLLLFYLPFTLCFIVPNVVRLAPWIWDNIKVLIYWFVASVPIVALLLVRMWNAGRVAAGLAGIAIVSLTLAGALDIWRVASNAVSIRVFDKEGIDFAKIVADTTGPTSLILHAPIHNHPIVLTGRRSVMGYAGHVWSHGLDPGPREADMKSMFGGSPDATALLRRYGIDFVVLGPPELRQMNPNALFFERYSRVAEAGGYRLYRIGDAPQR